MFLHLSVYSQGGVGFPACITGLHPGGWADTPRAVRDKVNKRAVCTPVLITIFADQAILNCAKMT